MTDREEVGSVGERLGAPDVVTPFAPHNAAIISLQPQANTYSATLRVEFAPTTRK